MADTQRRTTCTRTWVAAVLTWSMVRTLVVAHTLGRYGVNPWAYGALDLAVSGPYALATAGVVTNLLDGCRASARRCALVAAVTFMVPDVYLLVAGHDKPRLAYVVVVTVATVLAVSALLSLALQVRAGRVRYLAETRTTTVPAALSWRPRRRGSRSNEPSTTTLTQIPR